CPVLFSRYSDVLILPAFLKLPCKRYPNSGRFFNLCSKFAEAIYWLLLVKYPVVIPATGLSAYCKDLGSASTTPPIASEPYLRLSTPFTTVRFSAIKGSISGACSFPHCCASCLTPLLIVRILLPCKP